MLEGRLGSSPMGEIPRDPRLGAVIVAAGASTRMRGIDKIWAPLMGRPLVAWSVDAFVRTEQFARIVLVIARGHLAEAERLCQREGWADAVGVVEGGTRRRDSVRCGLEVLAATGSTEPQTAVIHDGARPLITPSSAAAGIAAAERTGAAIAIEPVKETVKLVREGLVTATLPRERLARAQTPQVYPLGSLLAALMADDRALDPPDEAATALAAGMPLATFPLGVEGFKVTAPEDLALIEGLLRARLGEG
jgi:2-C-methyl-D-erythritol 4-phosphate cytidylyltransferase